MHASRNRDTPDPGFAAVIVNTDSGTGKSQDVAHRTAEMLTARGVHTSVTVAHGAEVARAAREAVARHASLVVAGGGDGTISTIASSVIGTDTVLGVLPLGTLNHFAKDLGIPLDPTDAAAVVASGRQRSVDVGEVNGRFFLNNASIGVYARMVWERERERRGGRSRWSALGLALGRVWHHYRRVRVVVRTGDRERIVRTPFVVVANNEYQLDGTRLGARTRLDGACLQVSMAPDMTRYELVRMLVEAFTGRLQGKQHLETIIVETVTINARRHRIGVSRDGELSIIETPLVFRIRPAALRVMVPAS